MRSSLRTNAFSIRRVVSGFALFGALGAFSVATAQTETFESKSYAGACKDGGGAGIGYIGDKEWVGFSALDLVNFRSTCGFGLTNGYGALGGSVGEVLALGTSTAYVHSSNPFVLNSMVAGAGWQNPTSLLMEFYLNGTLLSTTSLQLTTNQTGLSLYSGFYTGATDFIRFTPTYPPVGDYSGDVFGSHRFLCPQGSPVDCTGRYETWFVDNLNFSPVAVVVTPEPATVGMIGFGLLALGVVGRKRRKAKA